MHRIDDVLQIGLGQEGQPLSPHLEPLGPQLDLPLRLLPGDIEDLGGAAQVVADLEHEGGLADARRAPHQHQGAPHRSAPQHPVQLPHAGGEAQLVGGLHLRHSLGAVQGHPQGAPPAGGRGLLGGLLRRALHHGVPRPAGGAPPLPLGGLVAALGTVKNGLGFHGTLLLSKKWQSHFFELGCTKFRPRCRRRKLWTTRIRVNPNARSLRCSSSPRKP